MNSHPAPHPIGVVPDYVRNLAYAIAIKLDVDIEMALATLLSGMAAAVHGLKRVKRPDDGFEPLSLFSVVLAGPTTGKTRTHKLVHRAHNAEDVRRYQDYQLAKKGRKSSKSANERGAASELATDTPRDAVAVDTWSGVPLVDSSKPSEQPFSRKPSDDPRLRFVIIQNSTNRGLIEAVEGVGEASSMSSHEGQNLLNSDVFKRHLETPNIMFEGNDKAMLTRANGDFVMAVDATLVILAMVQPDVLDHYFQKHGKHARDIGFTARILFTRLPHFRTPLDWSIQVPDDCLENYETQVTAYLRAQRSKLEAGITDREEMAFSPEACQLYWELAQEHRYLTNTTYWHMQDAANRAMQNVIRISAIMHAFSGQAGDIPPTTLAAAYAIVQWHLGQFAEIFPPEPLTFPPPPKPTTHQRQSQRLFDDRQSILKIITELCLHNREANALKSEVMTLFRERSYDARFRAALLRLVKGGEVLEAGAGKESRLSIVPQRTAPPAHLPSWAQYTSSL